jgi:putative hydrolase of the HAD superfamily
MLKALFLDAEGTFILFNPSLGEIYKNFWRFRGIEIDPEETSKEIRYNFKRIFKEELKPPLNGELCKKVWNEVFKMVFKMFEKLEVFEEVFREVYQFFGSPECVKIVPGFLEFLEKVKERGIKVAVVSNWDCRLYSVLEGHNLLSYFDGVFLGCEVGYLKPYPEIFLKALQFFNLKPNEVLMIGDTFEDDIKTPTELGMLTYHIQGIPDYHRIWAFLENHFKDD